MPKFAQLLVHPRLSRGQKWRRYLYRSLVVLLACLMILTVSDRGLAQFALPEGLGQASSSLPTGVSRYGDLEIAPVESPVDGKQLFEIAAPTVYDRDANQTQVPVEQRVEHVEGRLKLAINRRTDLTAADRDNLRVEISRLNNTTIITVSERAYPRPLVLISVTEQDADFNGLPIDDLAQVWRQILDDEIRIGRQPFSASNWVNSLIELLKILGLLIGITVTIGLVKYGISQRQKALEQKIDAIHPAESDNHPSDEPTPSIGSLSQSERLMQQQALFFQRFRRTGTIKLNRQLSYLKLIQWLLFWSIILAWYIGLLHLSDQPRGLIPLNEMILKKPIRIIVVWFLTGLVIRLAHSLIDRLKNSWQKHSIVKLMDSRKAQRRELRTSTIAGALKGLITVLVTITGVLRVLEILGIPTGSVLAIGGLIGLAVSFGSQNLVQDLVNGFLILAEDQYAIGDVIDIGNVAGLVEDLNLRITQLRSVDGELVTIPNSNINQVKNLTRTWSRVNFSIDVAYQTDPQKALSVLRGVAATLYNDPDWHDKMLSPPNVLGLDSVTHSGMTITTWIQTAPAQQWDVGREFRFRVRQALEANGIEIGVPQRSYSLESSSMLSKHDDDRPCFPTNPGRATPTQSEESA